MVANTIKSLLSNPWEWSDNSEGLSFSLFDNTIANELENSFLEEEVTAIEELNAQF